MDKINQSIFKEYDIRGTYPEEINEKTAYALGLAFAKVSGVKKIVVGRDARTESAKVFGPLVLGLITGGMKVFDLGVCATPEVFFTVGAKKIPSGVMVTASHSPEGQTGFKFCDEKGRVFGLNTGLKKIAKLADQEFGKISDPKKILANSKIEKFSIVKEYQKWVASFINPKNLKGLSLALDASSGSGGRLATAVFKSLSLKYQTINFLPQKMASSHGPNPLLPENQTEMSQLIKSGQFDFGVIFDGDADRSIFFDEKGEFIEPYYINCLLAELFLTRYKKKTITVDARLNLGISKVIKENGGRVLVHRSGYANFIKTMTAKKLLFGCENSGHFIFNFALKKSRPYVYGDAIIVILMLGEYLKKNNLKLSEEIKRIGADYQVSGEINLKADDFKKLEKGIRNKFNSYKFSIIDGLSIWDKKGEWFINIRPSHNEPLIRLNIEAKSQKKIKELKASLIRIINKK